MAYGGNRACVILISRGERFAATREYWISIELREEEQNRTDGRQLTDNMGDDDVLKDETITLR